MCNALVLKIDIISKWSVSLVIWIRERN